MILVRGQTAGLAITYERPENECCNANEWAGQTTKKSSRGAFSALAGLVTWGPSFGSQGCQSHRDAYGTEGWSPAICKNLSKPKTCCLSFPRMFIRCCETSNCCMTMSVHRSGAISNASSNDRRTRDEHESGRALKQCVE